MFTNKIYCFGDGFAHGHIWPEWPQILEALLPNYNIKIVSGVGAGPEYLVTQFSKLLPIDGPVIFQWPDERRFDKVIQDDQWNAIALNDSVYNFNTVEHDTETWWLSSASKSKEVIQYHSFFVQPTQAKIRSDVYRALVKEILDKTGYKYVFTSTHEQDRLSRVNMPLRGNEIQPSPLSHFYFLTEKILPQLELESNKTKLLEKCLLAQQWVPYDPDRDEIWANIKTQLAKPSINNKKAF